MVQTKSQKAEISNTSGAPASTTADAGRTAGIDLYERANDARRSGDHDGYNRLVRELTAYNAALAAAKGAS